MNSAIERLLTLRVCDVMSRNVITVEASKTMSQAATILTQHFISGAPVVGQQGQCVGIVSATDFVRCIAATNGNLFDVGQRDEKHGGATGNRHSCAAPAADMVASHMSALVETVSVDQPLTEAARTMCQNHIHRLIALDSQGRPAGVLTSLDIVAALINAIEE
jgi:predicted transcriptional regulator